MAECINGALRVMSVSLGDQASDRFSHDTMSIRIKIAMDQVTPVLARSCAKQFLYTSTLGPNSSHAKYGLFAEWLFNIQSGIRQ